MKEQKASNNHLSDTPIPERITPVSEVDPQQTSEIVRPIVREAGFVAQVPEPCEQKSDKGADSIPLQGIATQGQGQRMTTQQLITIQDALSMRDKAVLDTLKKYRFLLSKQVQRFIFYDGKTDWGNFVACNRTLNRLQELGMVDTLKRRIGGVRAGSSGKVWYLTNAGHRLLHLNDPHKYSRKRPKEPSTLFLNHILAVAETAVQLTLLCRDSHDLSLDQLDAEPPCWRPFNDSGRIIQLKPDLFAVTTYSNYEDRWFVEVDLGTESPAQIVSKCNVYLNYYYTGIEQRETKMFPFVLWIVPDQNRKKRLKEYIKENITDHPKMFLIITPNELENVLRQWIGREELC